MKIRVSNFFRFYYDFSIIFSDFISLTNSKKGWIYRAGPAELRWHMADMWQSHARPRGRLRGR